jgi:two-component system KDP operon response regulator KdpE
MTYGTIRSGENMTNPLHGRRILIVDDEPQIRIALSSFFTDRGFQVCEANDGETALGLVHSWLPELVITDLSMPRMGGILLCQQIRRVSSIPIVVLSVREEETIKVEALECGADDYVTKPFGMDELLARVRAALRRSSVRYLNSTSLDVGDFRINADTHRVEIRGVADEIPLTPKEFELLLYLMRNPRKVIPQKMLLNAIWGRQNAENSDSARALVRQIRKKIEPNPAAPKYLKTEPWIGYRFEPGE